MGRLTGRVAFVTGAARGMGCSHALALAREGAAVVGLDLGEKRPRLAYDLGSESQLEATMEECRALAGNALAVYADVSDAAQVERAVTSAVEQLGRVDILVNNAGITTGPHKLHELPEEDWDKMLDITLKGVFLTSKYVIPHMIRQKSGKIVNISSVAGLLAFPEYGSYVAAKFGVVGLTKSMAIELAPYGINVNCVCPGMVGTPMLDADSASCGLTAEQGRLEFAQGHLFKRLIPANDISAAVVWLASDDAQNITGIALPVDAGYTSNPPM